MEDIQKALVDEIERVQIIISVYRETPAGEIAAFLMDKDVKKGMTALAESDIEKMIEAYLSLQSWEI